MITVKVVQCSKCKQKIYSRARHDFHSCSCGATFVDGGFDYIRCGGVPVLTSGDNALIMDVMVDATLAEMYTDWNRHKIDIKYKPKYGWINVDD